MADGVVEGETRVLKPANENPWYVLMTLYGEQDGEEIDWELHEKNRAAWNAWACQGMTEERCLSAARSSRVPIDELTAWPKLHEEITSKHKFEMETRNNKSLQYLEAPDHNKNVVLEQTKFSQMLVLNGFIFPRTVFFEYSSFEKSVDFIYTTFIGNARFGRAEFRTDAMFPFSTFEREAWFYQVSFFEGTEFASSVFLGFTYFNLASFGTLANRNIVSFADCQFQKPTNFRDAIFHGRYPDFSGAVLHDKTTFTDNPANWPQGPQSDPARAKASCAVIRHTLGKQGLPEAEHFFFRREMGFATKIGPWWKKLPYQLFQIFSDFGNSILIPILWLAFFWAVGGLFYWHYFGLWPGLRTAAAFSFSNMFQVFGFGRLYFDSEFLAKLPVVLQFYAGAQTVVSLPLLFFLGLGLRTRFRMR